MVYWQLEQVLVNKRREISFVLQTAGLSLIGLIALGLLIQWARKHP